MRVARALAVTAVLLFAAVNGCSSTTAPLAVPDGGVIAENRLGEIVIINTRSEPIYTFVVGREAAATINWYPCMGLPGCPPINPGETRRILETDIISRDNETEAIVYWWQAIPGRHGRLIAGELRLVLVPLQ